MAVVALLIGGARLWPGIWLGSLLINASHSPTYGFPTWNAQTLLMANLVGAGAAAQALVAVTLVRRWVGYPNPLTAPRDILKFLALTGPVACLISPTTGTLAVWGAQRIALTAAPANWFGWWAGDTIGVLVFIPLSLPWLTPTTRRRQIIVSVPLVVTLGLVLAVHWLACDWERHRLQRVFHEEAEEVVTAVRARLDEALHTLKNLAPLFAGSTAVTESDFQQFVEPFLKNQSGIQALAWLPRVPHAERAAYELLQGPILQKDGATWSAATARDEYFPMAYFAPADRATCRRGFDAGSEQRLRAALMAARQLGTAVATDRLDANCQPPAEEGWWVFKSIHQGDELRGFVALVLVFSDYFAGALRSVDLRGLRVRWFDRAGLLFEAPRTEEAAAAELRPRIHEGVFAHQPWRLQVEPLPDFITDRRSPLVWVVLGGGLLLTGLLGAFLLVVSGQAARVEELVARRTAECEEAETRLRAAEKLAATGQMAARIAHEINNPLAGIHSAFLVVKDAVPADHPQRAFVPMIEREIDRIRTIVRRALDLHRPTPEPPREFVLQELIGDVVALLEPRQRQANVRIETELPPLPVRVCLPETGLSQVLFNLLENALEASPPHGIVRLAVTVTGVRVVVAVRDEGPGVPATVRAHLFEPFVTTKESGAGGGLGLGLSISYALAQSMGGELTLAETTGPGTTFLLTLPRLPNQPPEE